MKIVYLFLRAIAAQATPVVFNLCTINGQIGCGTGTFVSTSYTLNETEFSLTATGQSKGFPASPSGQPSQTAQTNSNLQAGFLGLGDVRPGWIVLTVAADMDGTVASTVRIGLTVGSYVMPNTRCLKFTGCTFTEVIPYTIGDPFEFLFTGFTQSPPVNSDGHITPESESEFSKT